MSSITELINVPMEPDVAVLPHSRYSPSFLRWLVVLAGATLIVAIFFPHILAMFRNQFLARSNAGYYPGRVETAIYPWQIAASHTVSIGVAEFQGADPMPVSDEARTGALIGLVVLTVVIPSVFMFSWRSLQAAKNAGGEQTAGLATLGFGFGLSLVLLALVPNLFTASRMPGILEMMRNGREVSELRDRMVSEIAMINNHAFQYKVLPREKGGGGNSYRGYLLPLSFNRIGDVWYAIDAVSDTTIAIIGRAQGSTGIVHAMVYPNGEYQLKTEGF